jgi:UvrD/REP helicase N-terminal domain
MLVNQDLYTERYEKLNDRQKEAVDYIYGPVMVIAGPGTGKTEVLSMRIASLLKSDAQVQTLCANDYSRSWGRQLIKLTSIRSIHFVTM